MQRKLGLHTEHEGDATLAEDLLTCMASNEADFTRTFRLALRCRLRQQQRLNQWGDKGRC